MAPKPALELIVGTSLVDEYGDLCQKIDAFAATKRAHEKAREALKALVASKPADAAFTAHGERYTLSISACGFESKPNVGKIRKLLGAAAFLEVVTITKKALEGWILKPEIEANCDVSQTGSRSFDPVPLANSSARRP